MASHDCVFIGGKQIGVNCLRFLCKSGIKPGLVIGNTDDTGEDTWHESLVKEARKQKFTCVQGKNVKDSEVIQKIKAAKPEIIFCIGGTQLIPKEVLAIPRIGCLNIHPALLPKYRGRFSTVHAIFNGEKETGVTAHWMDDRIDAGPIIFQAKIPIADDDTAKTLYDKFTHEGGALFRDVVKLWLEGSEIKSIPQNEAEATYCKKELPNKGVIDWDWDGIRIRKFILAMTFEPFPPADFAIGKKKMVIIDEKYFGGFGKK